MKRNCDYARYVDAQAITLSIPCTNGHEIKVGAVVAGRRLLVLCDEYPLQRWISEHRTDLLQAVVETGCDVRELKIYSDTHK
jgi:hypothetical protein